MIHKFGTDSCNIVLDVNSGAVHIVDDVVFDIVEFCENAALDEIKDRFGNSYPESSIEEAYEEIQGLKNDGLLFSEDIYEAVLPQVSSRKPVVKALCLHIAHDCNLKCRYCFAQEGEYHGKRALMSAETGKRAIDFLIKNSGSRRNLEVDFFGGEPLINFEAVKEIVDYARSIESAHNKNFRFTITTNGILLNDEIQEYINKNMHNVVLSIDGRREVNDRVRSRADGSGSYDCIVPKFLKMAESRNQKNYYVRGTFTAYNLDFSNDVLHLAELGFKQISVEPVVADANEDYALKQEHLPQIFEQYDRLLSEMSKRIGKENGFNFFHFMIDLEGGPCIAKRISGCGSGSEYLAVTPDGALYPCHQFAGIEEFKIGDVYQSVTNESLRKKFEGCYVYSKDECRDCWAKFYCSGGCAANAWSMNKDINKPFALNCELQRKRTECAILLNAAKNGMKI